MLRKSVGALALAGRAAPGVRPTITPPLQTSHAQRCGDIKCWQGTSLFSTTTEAHKTLEVERKDTVALVRLSRPKALNALCQELVEELLAELKRLDKDDSVRVIVLTGSGTKAFAAGADIKEMSQKDFAQVFRENLFECFNEMRQISKPIIAAVNGYALGGGCELAMMCDTIIAADTAKFGQPEILLGTLPGMGGTQRLTRAVGKAKAMEWILTGRQFSAEEAEKAGLVSRVVPKDKLEDEALKLAKQIAKFSLPAAAACKECVNAAFESSLTEGLQYERRMFHASFALADRVEGMKAFTEKRDPNIQDK
eukprot:Selendium_serpulae@DN5668_c0_g1_i1.p1